MSQTESVCVRTIARSGLRRLLHTMLDYKTSRAELWDRTKRRLNQFFVVTLSIIIWFELVYQLSSFPGLHADEAWMGNYALTIIDEGISSIHGMNKYTGALFPALVAVMFANSEVSITALRLPGALLNWASLAVLLITFWNRRYIPLFLVMLFGSSILFLFESRIAWEVSALQNFLLAVIIFALAKIMKGPQFWHVVTFFLCFALGTWNHFIFLVASISLMLTTIYIYMKEQNFGCRLLVLSTLNIIVQGLIFFGKLATPTGNFWFGVVGPLSIGSIIILVASVIFFYFHLSNLTNLNQFFAKTPALRAMVRWFLMGSVIAILVFSLRHLITFVSVVGGFLVLGRVASREPHLVPVSIGLSLAIIFVTVYSLELAADARRRVYCSFDVFRSALLVWPLTSLAIIPLALAATPGIPVWSTAIRYFLIPHFLFLVALAFALEEARLRWAKAVQVILIAAVLHGQFFVWTELTRAENRNPIDLEFWFFNDTSRHFLRLDNLYAYLKENGLCNSRSPSYFIDEPLKLMRHIDPIKCRTQRTAVIQYCDSCQSPVRWFAVTYE